MSPVQSFLFIFIVRVGLGQQATKSICVEPGEYFELECPIYKDYRAADWLFRIHHGRNECIAMYWEGKTGGNWKRGNCLVSEFYGVRNMGELRIEYFNIAEHEGVYVCRINEELSLQYLVYGNLSCPARDPGKRITTQAALVVTIIGMVATVLLPIALVGYVVKVSSRVLKDFNSEDHDLIKAPRFGHLDYPAASNHKISALDRDSTTEGPNVLPQKGVATFIKSMLGIMAPAGPNKHPQIEPSNKRQAVVRMESRVTFQSCHSASSEETESHAPKTAPIRNKTASGRTPKTKKSLKSDKSSKKSAKKHRRE